MPGIFDTHAHYDDKQFDDDREVVIKALPASGIELVVNCSSSVKSLSTTMELARNHSFFYGTLGIHPHNSSDYNSEVEGSILEGVKDNKIVAIGEIGLDYHYDFSPRDVQKQVFARQLELAKELDLPVVIHSREAVADTMDIIKKYRPKGIVHCFSGDEHLAKQMVDLGLYIGFTGVVTFKNAKKPLLAAAAVPMDRLLIETDCPYMAPVPNRGKRCDSTMLHSVVQVLSELKGIQKDEFVKATFENGLRVFEIKR